MTTNLESKGCGHPATRKEIREHFEIPNRATVDAIRDTGASLDDIFQATKWLSDRDYMASEGQTMSPCVGNVCELLRKNNSGREKKLLLTSKNEQF